MSPLRRTALASVVAAAVLVAIKLVTGLAAGSLGLVADAAHSGTDLVAALLTFFAVGLATKPADAGHLYGHGDDRGEGCPTLRRHARRLFAGGRGGAAATGDEDPRGDERAADELDRVE